MVYLNNSSIKKIIWKYKEQRSQGNLNKQVGQHAIRYQD